MVGGGGRWEHSANPIESIVQQRSDVLLEVLGESSETQSVCATDSSSMLEDSRSEPHVVDQGTQEITRASVAMNLGNRGQMMMSKNQCAS